MTTPIDIVYYTLNMEDNNTHGIRPAPPKPYGPVPTERQLRWHERELYGFLHFTVNTFTDKEWGYGDESPRVFAPSAFDAEQIVSTAARAGMSGLILTCKHHDGFCLWPSAFTEHSVKHSPWRNGDGDVVREISDACARNGIAFGIYLSPWDRNHAEYGRPEYVEYFRNQLRELTTNYGELFEVWFDGANGGDGYYGGAREQRRIDRRTYYGWDETWRIVRDNQPNAVIFSDAGPDIRWVGNEKGVAGDPCWATLTTKSLYPGFGGDAWAGDQKSGLKMLNTGVREGDDWLPAECDVSIRPGWFYHPSEDDEVRTPRNLIDIYFASVGRGASLLLNLPPDRRGVIHGNDVDSLTAFHKQLTRAFAHNLAANAHATAEHIRGNSDHYSPINLLSDDPDSYWCTDDDVRTTSITYTFDEPVTFNVVSLREYLPLGQRIDRFAVDVDSHGRWQRYADGASIGSHRLLRGPSCTTGRFRFTVLESRACPAIAALTLHRLPD